MVKIGIISGTGIGELLTDTKQIKSRTPFGPTSDPVAVGSYEDVEVVVVPRHGRNHQLNPSNVCYRANIWAMKELGVTHILAPSAVGSLKERIKPGDLLLPDQFIDRTAGRKSTFYEGSQVCHISAADPLCPTLRKLLIEAAKRLKIKCHPKGTCVVIEGPRFSTRAESKIYRRFGADVIGMTMVPECVLAREAQICYQSVAMITDYDCWKERAVDVGIVATTMKKNVEKVKKILTAVIPKIKDDNCACKHALDEAFI